jgi:hypothetical protein
MATAYMWVYKVDRRRALTRTVAWIKLRKSESGEWNAVSGPRTTRDIGTDAGAQMVRPSIAVQCGHVPVPCWHWAEDSRKAQVVLYHTVTSPKCDNVPNPRLVKCFRPCHFVIITIRELISRTGIVWNAGNVQLVACVLHPS